MGRSEAPGERVELVRGFIALLLEAAVIEELQVVQRLLRQRVPEGIRWTRPDQMHLTLHFLGSVGADEMEEVGIWLGQACSGHAAFSLRLDGLGLFPEAGRPRVVWVGLNGELDRLRRLQEDVVGAMKRFGERSSGQPFRPHLTLGRTRPDAAFPAGLASLLREGARPRPVGWSVREVLLMRSELAPSGARHTVLVSVPLV